MMWVPVEEVGRVAEVDLQKTVYLALDHLTWDPKLVRRLPPEVAWRCHALPLAEDNGRVTVAMADPDDVQAREAVVTVLGPQSCVVKGDPTTIDARLAEVWGADAERHLQARVCAFPEPLPDEVWAFVHALGALLGAHLARLDTGADLNALFDEGGGAGADLIILGQRAHAQLRHLLSRSIPAGAATGRPGAAPFAVLVAQRPRWPLRRLLLVVCGEDTDEGAVDWALRLAVPSAAAVTVLAVVPPVPAMYHGLARMENSLASVLTTHTALGCQMRRVARRLVESRVDGTLRLRQGAPDQQVRRELVEGDPDLVIMATKPCRWFLRQLKGEPICSLLTGLDRPLLLAQPTTACPP